MIRRMTPPQPAFPLLLFTVLSLFTPPRIFALPNLQSTQALGSLTECAELLNGGAPSAFDEEDEERAFERGSLTQSNGPFQQKVVAREEVTPSGEKVWFVGLESAMKHVDPRTAFALPILKALKGNHARYDIITSGGHSQSVQILTAGAVTGSAARLRLTKQANDYDFETLLIVKEQQGSLAQLSHPQSPEIQAIARYLQEHVEQVIQDHPEYRFIELKAGTYLHEYDPDTGERKGVKWNIHALRAGEITITDGNHTRKMTLTQALAEDARIKADWAVPNPNPEAPIPNSYIEATALYRLGLQIGNNQPRLRGSDHVSGVTEALPLRATSLVMDQEDLHLILDTSRATTSVAKERVHQAILRSIKKYLENDHFKVIKRVAALLQFWDYDNTREQFGMDFALFIKKIASQHEHAPLSNTKDNKDLFDKTQLQLRNILRNDRLLELSQIKAQAELLEVLEEQKISLPEGVAELWLDRVTKRFHSEGLFNSDLPSVLAFIDKKINQQMESLLTENRFARLYEEFVLKRMSAMEGTLSETPSFLASAPSDEFLRLYRKKLRQWKRDYPNLEFTRPEDLHMTWHYNGKITDVARDVLRKTLSNFGNGLQFSNGGIGIVGRNDDILAFRYPTTVEQSRNVALVKAIAAEQGARPELRFFAFNPHITFAKFDPQNPEAKTEMNRLLSEAVSQFESVTLKGLEIWENNPENPTRTPNLPHYRVILDSR